MVTDLISRQAAIDAIYHHLPGKTFEECAQMLHEVPSTVSKTEQVDCISRQKAMASPQRMYDARSGIEWVPVYWLKNLPSAVPEVIRCKDCIHYNEEIAICYYRNMPRQGECFCSDGERLAIEE